VAQHWLSTFPEFSTLREKIMRQPHRKKLLLAAGLC